MASTNADLRRKMDIDWTRQRLKTGLVIPAHPLALTPTRRIDERHQRALTRYYSDAGAGGIAIGVHTTQFEIRQPSVGLYEPVVELASDEINRLDEKRTSPLVRIGGICGETTQALREAEILARSQYHAGLVSLAAMPRASEEQLIEHCRLLGEVIPLFGFYLQTAVGGRPLPYSFWRRFFELESVVAVKIAPFDRYQTIDVIRALADSERDDVALYTGNDDSIFLDLMTPFRVGSAASSVPLYVVGGLLGQWAVWTRTSVAYLDRIKEAHQHGDYPGLLALHADLTDANSAIFDTRNAFRGCIAGIHEVLRRQGLLPGIHLLEGVPGLSPGQSEEIDRVVRAYPHLTDDDFVKQNRDLWLR